MSFPINDMGPMGAGVGDPMMDRREPTGYNHGPLYNGNCRTNEWGAVASYDPPIAKPLIHTPMFEAKPFESISDTTRRGLLRSQGMTEFGIKSIFPDLSDDRYL